MNGRKLSVNKACLFLAVLLLVAMGTVSAALYGLTQNITAVWYVVLFGIFVLLCAVCFNLARRLYPGNIRGWEGFNFFRLSASTIK